MLCLFLFLNIKSVIYVYVFTILYDFTRNDSGSIPHHLAARGKNLSEKSPIKINIEVNDDENYSDSWAASSAAMRCRRASFSGEECLRDDDDASH